MVFSLERGLQGEEELLKEGEVRGERDSQSKLFSTKLCCQISGV